MKDDAVESNRVFTRRTLLIGLATTGLVPLSGCMTRPPRPVNADGTYCHSVGKRPRPTLTCTPEAVPSAAVEAEAKRFEAVPGALTVYVLRRRWGDASVVVPITVDGVVRASTIPESLVRLRLKPGVHRLQATWEGRSTGIDVAGQAGEVRVVELNGSGWAWGASFDWQLAGLDDTKSRAAMSKLVADIDLRH